MILTKAQIERNIKEQCKEEISVFLKKLQKEENNKIQEASYEITGYMRLTVARVFLNKFLENYGENFDVSSLLRGIKCGVYFHGKDIVPEISFDKTCFTMNYSLANNVDFFNSESTKLNFHSIFGEEELGAMAESDEITEYDDPYDVMLEELNTNNIKNNKIFSPINKALRQGGFRSLDDVIVEAKIEAMQSFLYEYKNQIRPKIMSKYGVN